MKLKYISKVAIILITKYNIYLDSFKFSKRLELINWLPTLVGGLRGMLRKPSYRYHTSTLWHRCSQTIGVVSTISITQTRLPSPIHVACTALCSGHGRAYPVRFPILNSLEWNPSFVWVVSQSTLTFSIYCVDEWSDLWGSIIESWRQCWLSWRIVQNHL
jgi:hypothetical protein